MADSTKRRKIDRVEFLSEHVIALKEAIHHDIIVKPGDNGPRILLPLSCFGKIF